MNDEQFNDTIEKFKPAFMQAYINARFGNPHNPTVLDTQWGPIEGTRDGDSILWDFPDHSWAEFRYLADGSMEMYRNDELVARIGPTGIEEETDDDLDA
jgi:hypothetical protein